jgi:hypothetical protein
MRPSRGGKPPQRGTRVGGLLSVSGCSGGGAPLTRGEGDRRGPLAAEGVGALARVGPGFLHPREREFRALSRCWRRRSDLEGSRRAAWRRRPDARPGGGGVEARGLEGGCVGTRGLEAASRDRCGRRL